ncbi:MAG: armadillo-type protein [Benjaminiella poitrasii]|nr:MAG: armadillo-type protein [Benjaminiella poitrasii]
MGKQRPRRKTSKRRLNPLQRKAVEAGLKETNSKLPTTEQLNPIIQKLSSEDGGERAWAAACVSNLILSNASTRKLLLTKGVVPLLIERLGDQQQEVRDESLGALRNLVSIDDTVAKEYYSRNILTPLSVMLPQITQTIDLVLKGAPIQDEADQERRKSIWDVTENFIYIIWCLCEASNKYVKAINRMNIIPFLTSFLISGDSCPTRVIIAAGQCLNTLSDDNKDLYIEFQQHQSEYIQPLLNIIRNEQYDNIFIQVLTCAVLVNIRDVVRLTTSWDDDTDTVSELNKLIVPVLIKALDYDMQQAAVNTMQAMASLPDQQQEEDITPRPKQALTDEETYVQNVEDRLSIIQLALELLADICVQDDDSEEDGYQDETMMIDEEEGGKREEGANDDDIDANLFTDKSRVDDALIRSDPVVHAYITRVFPRLIQLGTFTAASFHNRQFTLSHQRAFECLNNFLLAMNDVPSKFWFKEYQTDAVQLWRWLFNCADQVAGEEKMKNGMLEIIISCLWALGRGLVQNIPLKQTDVGALCGTYEMIPLESMRVKIVGCLGPIAMRQGDIETNKTIGVFVMTLLSNKQSPVTVVIEGLNLFFDVYSDLGFDYDLPVFVQGGFLNHLKQILPSVRSKMKSIDRRKDFDLRMRGDEALDNLTAFIKYKRIENNKREKKIN